MPPFPGLWVCLLLSILGTVDAQGAVAPALPPETTNTFWQQKHPRWQEYFRAETDGNWSKAATLAAGFETIFDTAEMIQRYGDVCAKANRHDEAFGFWEKAAYQDYLHSNAARQRVLALRTFALKANQLGQRPRNAALAVYARLLANPTSAALRRELEELATNNSTARDILIQVATEAYERAAEAGDWAAAMAATRPTGSKEAYPQLLLAQAEALERAGDPKAALAIFEGAIWHSEVHDAPFSPLGNPDLARRAAACALRNDLTPREPLVKAYQFHLEGDTASAVLTLETFIRDSRFYVVNPPMRATAMFLLGDIFHDLKELKLALSWYYYATYTVLDTTDVTAVRTVESDRRRISQSRYHRIWGGLRQARVLLDQKKPGLALEEMAGLMEDPELAVTVRNRLQLVRAWDSLAKELDEIYSRPERGPGFARPDENADSLPDDLIVSLGRRDDVRRSTSGARFRAQMGRLQKLIEETARAEKRAREQAEQQAREEAERRRVEEARRYADSYRRMLQQLKDSGFTSTRRSGRLVSAPTTAFRFSSTLEKPNRSGSTIRRCALCLGSGYRDYVVGGPKVQKIRNQYGEVIDTAPSPPCSSCDGTGYREW